MATDFRVVRGEVCEIEKDLSDVSDLGVERLLCGFLGALLDEQVEVEPELQRKVGTA